MTEELVATERNDLSKGSGVLRSVYINLSWDREETVYIYREREREKEMRCTRTLAAAG